MIIQDLINELQYGAYNDYLSNDNFGDPTTPVYLHALNISLNRAIKRLHGDVPLISKAHLLKITPGRMVYYLKKERALTDTSSTIALENRYIIDSEYNPFNGTMLRVLGVFDHNGKELPINTIHSIRGVTMPKYNVIELKKPDKCFYSFTYQDSLLPFVYDPADQEAYLNQEIDIPPDAEPALMFAILMMIARSATYQEGEKEETDFRQLYEKEKQDLINKNVTAGVIPDTYDLLHRNGYL